MRTLYIFGFALMLLFSSSCVMKKILVHYLDMQPPLPAKAMPVQFPAEIENASSDCSLQAEADAAFTHVDMVEASLAFHLDAPLWYVLLALYLCCALRFPIQTNYCQYRDRFLRVSPVPLYVRLHKLLLYD